MKLTPERLAAMIRRDPVAVTYTIGSTVVTTTGLLHRGDGQRGKDDAEESAGTIDREMLKVMVRAADVAAAIPADGMKLNVGGGNYRAGAVELSSDQTHYVIFLLDENG